MNSGAGSLKYGGPRRDSLGGDRRATIYSNPKNKLRRSS